MRNLGRLDPAPEALGWPAGVVTAAGTELLPAARTGGIVRWLGPAISLGIIAVALDQFRGTDIRQVWAIVPTSPLFWMVFVAAYCAQPLADLIIFRRLWDIPLAAGFTALLRKLVGNEVLLGYIGELYFYSWARRRAAMVGAPFGAIKDVAILSALVGNTVTLVMLGVAWPMLSKLSIGLEGRTLVASIGALMVSSFAVMMLRRRLFSLKRDELVFVGCVQLARVLATTGLAALMWSLVLPQVPLTYWVLLATLRLLISRLPLVPNKDVVFAGAAVLLVGSHVAIAPLMAMMAGLIVVVHVILGSLLVLPDFVGGEARA
ncbi:MAG: hypothetical protein ACRYG4_23505 [Janthinobacterium lividum]